MMSELTIYQLLAPDEINYLKSFGKWSNSSFIMLSEYLDMIGFGGNTTLLEQLDNWVESDSNGGNPSELENTLVDSMLSAGIRYDRQFPYALGLADFFIPPNHIVEVQGTFWHADPTKYSGNRMIKEDKQAHEIWANDARKKRFLQQQGYKVLHLWEREITASIENVLKTIISSITSFSHSFSHSFFANVNLRDNNSSHVNDMEI